MHGHVTIKLTGRCQATNTDKSNQRRLQNEGKPRKTSAGSVRVERLVTWPAQAAIAPTYMTSPIYLHPTGLTGRRQGQGDQQRQKHPITHHVLIIP